jgi:hypothetical protein
MGRVVPSMDKLHDPQLLDRDGATPTRVASITRNDGQPVSPEQADKIHAWASRQNLTPKLPNPEEVVLTQQKQAVGTLGQILGVLGDKFELEDLEKQVPALKTLAEELKATPAYAHLNGNGSLNHVKEQVQASSATREGRVQFAWVSLLAELARSKSISELYASVVLWVPMVLLANASTDV